MFEKNGDGKDHTHDGCRIAIESLTTQNKDALGSLKAQNVELLKIIAGMRMDLEKSNTLMMKFHGIGHERHLAELREENILEAEKNEATEALRARVDQARETAGKPLSEINLPPQARPDLDEGVPGSEFP